jgi:hypothetical protein
MADAHFTGTGKNFSRPTPTRRVGFSSQKQA